MSGWSHRPVQTPSVSIFGCNSVKVVDQHLFLNIIPSNFTAETGRKVWCDQGMSRGSLQLERSGDYDNVMSEVEAPGLSYPRHQLCSSYEFCFHRVCQWGGRRGKEGRALPGGRHMEAMYWLLWISPAGIWLSVSLRDLCVHVTVTLVSSGSQKKSRLPSFIIKSPVHSTPTYLNTSMHRLPLKYLCGLEGIG